MSTTDRDAPQTVAEQTDIRVHDAQWRLMNKYKMKRFPGKKITLPFGVEIPASLFANVRPPGSDDSFILHSPEKVLKHPRPQHRYIWRLRAHDETIGLVETQQMRPVAMSEIRTDAEVRKHTAKILAYTGPSADAKTVDRYVGWKRYALFEIGPDLAYEWFGRPEDWALAKMAGLGEAFENDVAKASGGKMQGRFEVKDPGRK